MKRAMLSTLFVICLAFSDQGLFAFITNQSADVVIGHRYFSQSGTNGNDAGRNTLYSPSHVYCEISGGSRVLVADTYNNRVLIYNKPPVDFDAVPDVVIGQPDFYSKSPNQGGNPGPNTLFYPRAVYTYGSLLLISDSGNHRVLIYNSIPASNNAGASLVIGQPDLNHNLSNQGGTVAANTLSNPGGICSYGSALFIADCDNNRVLKFNDIPGYNNQNAALAIGQPSKNANQGNNGGLSGATLSAPADVWVVGAKLAIADLFNHRVLIYNDVNQINTDGKAADAVVGQADMTHNSENQGNAGPEFRTLSYPASVYSDGSKLFVSDSGNHRLLIYNSIPASPNASADIIVGQTDQTRGEANRGYNASRADTLNNPRHVFVKDNRIYVADAGNHRLLIFNSVPKVNNIGADLVLGQSDMAQNAANRLEISAASLGGPRHVLKIGDKLFIADSSNNRILVHNHFPSDNLAKADVVIGQVDMQGNNRNRGGVNPSALTLSCPYGLCSTDDKLLVADYNNHRVLIYNISDIRENLKADVVIGQPDMTHNGANQNGSCSDKTLLNPSGICTDGVKLIVADSGNNRVLVFNHIPQTQQAGADLVIGQADMTGGTANRGSGSASANTMYTPCAVGLSGNRLVVADWNNHRVLLFNSIPTALNAAADVVIGQPDMTSHLKNQGGGVYANTLWNPSSFCLYNNSLYLTDYSNHRILIYNTLPNVNNAGADLVIGQSYMSGSAANQGTTPARNTLSYPRGVYVDDSGLFVADSGNNRVLEFLNPLPLITPTATPDIAYQNDIRAFNSRFNPLNGGQTYIRWHQSETARTTIKIYTLRGELVKTLIAGNTFQAGPLNEVLWNGLNSASSVVAAGIYIVHIEAGRYQESIKVAVIK